MKFIRQPSLLQARWPLWCTLSLEWEGQGARASVGLVCAMLFFLTIVLKSEVQRWVTLQEEELTGLIWKLFNSGGIAWEHNLFRIFLPEPKLVMVWEQLFHSPSPFLHTTEIFMHRTYRLYKHLFKNHIKILYIVTHVSFQMDMFAETQREILHTLYIKTANLEIGRAALPKWVEKLGLGLNKQPHKSHACFYWTVMHERPRVANLNEGRSQPPQ